MQFTAQEIAFILNGTVEGDAMASDPIEHESSRPDFAIGLATWHWRQKDSPFRFPKDAPPVFLVHATNDGIGGGAPIEMPRATSSARTPAPRAPTGTITSQVRPSASVMIAP